MKARTAGLTLVSLLVAVGLGSLLLLSLSTLWLQARLELQRGEALARLQDTGRHVLGMLQREVALAGYAGGVPSRHVESRVDASLACSDGVDWAVSALPAVDVAPSPGTPSVTVAGHQLDCIPGEDIQPGSPLLVLRRSATWPALTRDTSSMPADGRWYLARDGSRLEADWLFLPEGASRESMPLGQHQSYWDWRVAIFYLRRWSQRPGDGIPTLCMEHLQVLRMVTECLAEGVEQWVLEFGLDLDHNGVVDTYREAPAAEHLARARMLQVHLLLRSVSPIAGPRQAQELHLGPRRLQRPADGYFRRTLALALPLTNLGLQHDLERLP